MCCIMCSIKDHVFQLLNGREHNKNEHSPLQSQDVMKEGDCSRQNAVVIELLVPE